MLDGASSETSPKIQDPNHWHLHISVPMATMIIAGIALLVTVGSSVLSSVTAYTHMQTTVTNHEGRLGIVEQKVNVDHDTINQIQVDTATTREDVKWIRGQMGGK